MGYALIAHTPSAALGITNSFVVPGGGGAWSNVEVRAQFKVRVAGTFDKLQILINANGTARSNFLRKNTANGTLTVAPTDSTAGLYVDNTHSDAVVAGDLIDFSAAYTAPAPTVFSAAMRFAATTNHACFYANAANGAITAASTTTFLGLSGFTTSTNATEANSKCRARVAGTMQNGQIEVSANRATTSTLKNRINGADGTIAISITGSSTGLFEDTSHSDAFSAGDDLNWALTTSTGADTMTPRFLGCAIVNAASAANDLFAGAPSLARAASATADYYSITGRIQANTTEANAKLQHSFHCNTSRMRLFVSAYSYGAAATARLRKNGADGNQTFSISGTGLFEDTSHTDDFAATDDVCISVVGGSSGSATFEWLGLTETDVSTVNESVSESGTALDAPSSQVDFAASDAESGTALDAPSSQVDFAASDAESGSAVDAPSMALTLAPTVAESGAALDSGSSQGDLGGSASEAGSAVDTQSSSAVLAATESESGTALDAPSSQIDFVADDAEAGSALDAPSSQVDFVSNEIEAGTALDTPSSQADFVVSEVEAGSAQDVASTGNIISAAISESAGAADSASSQGTLGGSISESGGLADDPSMVLSIAAAAAEAASLADMVSAAVDFSASITEVGLALDNPSAIAIFFVAVNEAGNAIDLSDVNRFIPLDERYIVRSARRNWIVPSSARIRQIKPWAPIRAIH